MCLYSNWQGFDEERTYAFRCLEGIGVIEAVQRFLLQVFQKKMLDSGALNKIEAVLINTRLISKMSPPYEMTSVALIDLMKEKIPRAFSLLASAFRAIKSTSDI